MPLHRNTYTIGLDENLPSPGLAMKDHGYRAIDTGVLYRCLDADTWAVEMPGGGIGPLRCSLRGFASNVMPYCAASVGASPTQESGTGGVLYFYPFANPAAAEILFDTRAAAGNKGIDWLTGNVAGDRCQIQAVFNPDVISPLHTYAGRLNAPQALAWAHVGNTVRSVLNNGAVVESAAAGPFVPRVAGDRLVIGGSCAPASNASVSSGLIAVRLFSTQPTDADLGVMTNLAHRQTWRPPALGHTTNFYWNANLYPDGVTAITVAGERFTYGTAVNFTLRKIPHVDGRPTLPLGDSITVGTGTTPLESYRRMLFEKMASGYTSWRPGYVGSQVSGTQENNHCEAHSGYTIAQLDAAMAAYADLLAAAPQVVLVLAGVNDLLAVTPAVALTRMGALLATLKGLWPTATVLVSSLTPVQAPCAVAPADVVTFNAGLPAVVAAGGGNYGDIGNSITVGELQADGVHPTPAGYALMANAWAAALKALLP